MTTKTQKTSAVRKPHEVATEAARVAGKLFQPGNRANPGGKPVGSRNRLQGDFLQALADDFAAHGRAAIIRVREERPADYLRVIASLMPKEIDVGTKFGELSDDELAAGIATLRAIIAAQASRESTIQ